VKTCIAIVAFSLLAACNTIEGAGRDIQAGGEVISEGASKTKKAITR